MKTNLFASTAVFVTIICGIFYDSSFASVADISKIGPSFVLACRAETIGGSPIVGLTSNRGVLSVQVDYENQTVTFTDPQLFDVTDAYVSASWPELGFAIDVESSQDNRIFGGHFYLNSVQVVAHCFKIVTSERDPDEFSLYCVPETELGEVVLSYEERELELLLNPTTNGEILDFERTTDLLVTDSMIEGSWDLEQVRFHAYLEREDRFTGTLTHRSKSSVSLECWRI